MPRGRGRKRSTATANLSQDGPRQTRARTSQGRSEPGSGLSNSVSMVSRTQMCRSELGNRTSSGSGSVSRPQIGETSALNSEVVSNESQNGGPERSEAGTSAGPSVIGRGQLLGVNLGNSSAPFITTSYNVTFYNNIL